MAFSRANFVLMDSELLYLIAQNSSLSVPTARVFASAGQAATNSYLTASWDATPSYSNGGMSTSTTGITVPRNGYYAVQSRMTLASTGGAAGSVPANTRAFIVITTDTSQTAIRSDEVYGNLGYYVRNLSDIIYLYAYTTVSTNWYVGGTSSHVFSDTVGAATWLAVTFLSF